ncbi:twin-arginine translocation signal domain-containing protein, partial [Pseudomonas sp. D(2018)]
MNRPYPIHPASGGSRRTFLKLATAAAAAPLIGRPLASLGKDDDDEDNLPV